MLSVVIITKNEAHSIRECLESVAWADQIVVVDSGSTDDTVAICREFTDKVVVRTDWPGFGPQKNRALDLATGDWVLSIDADERVTPALRAEIEAALGERGASAPWSLRLRSQACNAVNAVTAISEPRLATLDGRPSHQGADAPRSPVAWRMPRLSLYCGRYLRHSGWWPDYVVRLFRRGQARFSDDLVHERLIVDGPVGTLTEPLQHESFRTLEDVLEKVNRYSTAGARMMHARGKRGTLTTAVLRGLWSFVRTYFLRAGFLDGREGFMVAVSNAEGTYYRYLKLMLMTEKP